MFDGLFDGDPIYHATITIHDQSHSTYYVATLEYIRQSRFRDTSFDKGRSKGARANLRVHTTLWTVQCALMDENRKCVFVFPRIYETAVISRSS